VTGGVGLVIHSAAELVTLAGPQRARRGEEMRDLAIVHDGAVAAADGRLAAVGRTAEIRERVADDPALAGIDWREIDASGRCVTPGLVDPHTHLVFAGSRPDEQRLRQAGRGYLEILAAGGGILSTVRATRAAGEAELHRRARRWLHHMAAGGVTTVEAKSGYGLDREAELRQLRVLERLDGEGPVRVVPTVLAAHAVPPEYAGRADAYVDEVAVPLAREAGHTGLARFVDAFCERGVFDVHQSRRALLAGRSAGLGLRLHADELAASGGAALAAELQAASADHLGGVDDDGIEALASVGGATVATLLPITTLYLDHPDAPARRLVEAGIPVAIGSDFNPGTSPAPSMLLALWLARSRLRLDAAEALTAATINAAASLGLAASIGSLEPGKHADLVIWDIASHAELGYWAGVELAHAIVRGGRVMNIDRPSVD
jgi:imidazolonepropionase